MPRYLVSAIVLAGLLGPAEAALLRVPVERARVHRPASADPAALSAAVLAEGRGEAGEPTDVRLVNIDNMGYSGKIRVGTPGQTFTVVFDTGSASMWVPGTRSAWDPLGWSAAWPAERQYYQPRRSSTFEAKQQNFRIAYGSGAVSGFLCKDDVFIGDLELKGFTFGDATDTSGIKNYGNMNFDGIVGLGFQRLSLDGLPTVMDTLNASGQLEEPVFGFYLGDAQPGELVFGGVAPEHYVGKFVWADVTHEAYWEVALEGVALGSILTLNATRAVILDSGTSLLVGPQEEVTSLAAMLGAQQVQGLYVVDCHAEVPDISFKLGGQTFSLSKEELIIERVQGFCVLGMQAMQLAHPMWILGDVFMRKYYVQFDWGKKRVGFALAASKAKGADNLV